MAEVRRRTVERLEPLDCKGLVDHVGPEERLRRYEEVSEVVHSGNPEELAEYIADISKGAKLSLSKRGRRERKAVQESDEVYWRKENISLNVVIDGLKRENAKLQKQNEQLVRDKEALKTQFKEQLAAKEAEHAETLGEQLDDKKRFRKLLATETKLFEDFVSSVAEKDKDKAKLVKRYKLLKQSTSEKVTAFEEELALKDEEIKKKIKEMKQQRVIHMMKLQIEETTKSKLRRDAGEFERTLQDKEEIISKEKEEKKKLKERIVQLEKEVKDARKMCVDRARFDKEEQKSIYRELTHRNKVIATFRLKADEKEHVISKLHMKIKELQGSIQSLERELKGVKRERKALFRVLENERSKSGILKVSLDERTKMIQALEEELEEEKAKQGGFIKRIQAHAFRYQELNDKHKTLTAAYSGVKPEVDRCNIRIRQLENKIISMQCDIQNCVDVFHRPRAFLPCFVKLKEKHLDKSQMRLVDCEFTLFHRYVKKLEKTYTGTIASQRRDRDNLVKLVTNIKECMYRDYSVKNFAIENYDKLQAEKKALEVRLRGADAELKILKRPVVSKVKCWINQIGKSKVHPAEELTEEKLTRAAEPPPCFESVLQDASDVSDSRCLPSPETSPSPILYYINYIPDSP